MKRLGVIILLMAFALGISAQENKDSLCGMADSLSNVVSSAYKKGDYYEALDAQQQVVDIYEKTGNTNNQTYVLALNDLWIIILLFVQLSESNRNRSEIIKTEESIFGKIIWIMSIFQVILLFIILKMPIIRKLWSWRHRL